MSMERAIKRNVDRNVTSAEHLMRLIPPSEDQKALTSEWVLPYAELIVADVSGIRTEVDKKLRKDPGIRAGSRAWGKEYPEGRCQEIRDAVLGQMEKDMLDRQYPGLQALKNFVRQGGVVKPFWGIDQGKYFQNAIQLGDAILDVANDTVDKSKVPVVLYPNVHEAPIRPIEHFSEFADVVEKYWGYTVYPNIYLPWFAPVFPVLVVRPPAAGITSDNRLYLERNAIDLAYKNILTVRDGHAFGLSSEFLLGSPYGERRLPKDMYNSLLEDPRLRSLQQKRPDIFRITDDPDEARHELAQQHVPAEGADFRDYLKHMYRVADQARIFEERVLARTPG